MSVPFIVCALITAISALVSFGYSVAAVVGSTGEAKTLALYASARSVALLIVSLVPLLTGSRQWLLAIACAMIIVQASDAAIGWTIKDRMKTFGPAGTAVVNLAALLWLVWALP